MSKRVIFLDRDGVINRERGEYTYRLEDVEWVTDLFESLKIFKDHGFEFIVISNQGGVAKGIYSMEDVMAIQNAFEEELSKHDLKLLDHYYCPHHQDFTNCLCRKPKSNMLERAIAKHDIDVGASYFIGDSERDVQAGEALNVRSFKVSANHSILELSKSICND